MKIMNLIKELYNHNLTYTGRKIIIEKIENIELERDNYKSRCEKAVEYIDNDDNFWVALGEECGKPNDDLDKLLNILKGKGD